MADETENPELPDAFSVVMDFDSLYSKGLLMLGNFPRERRLQELRIPVISTSFGFCVLQCVFLYRLWKTIRKRYGGLWAILAAGASAVLASSLWMQIPVVNEFCTLEWDLAQKYRPIFYV